MPTQGGFVNASDLTLENDTMSKILPIDLGQRIHGAKPRNDIFKRPILRRRKPKDGNTQAPWDNSASVSVFPSALQAVQQLSFGSLKVRHVGWIDDVLIANNIANSANGERTESYNFMWGWQDNVGEIQLNLKRQRSLETSRGTLFTVPSHSSQPGKTGNQFLSRLTCLTCGNDTTVE